MTAGAGRSSVAGWALTAGYTALVLGVLGAVEFGLIARSFGLIAVLLATAIYIPLLRSRPGRGGWRSPAGPA